MCRNAVPHPMVCNKCCDTPDACIECDRRPSTGGSRMSKGAYPESHAGASQARPPLPSCWLVWRLQLAEFIIGALVKKEILHVRCCPWDARSGASARHVLHSHQGAALGVDAAQAQDVHVICLQCRSLPNIQSAVCVSGRWSPTACHLPGVIQLPFLICGTSQSA